MHSAQARVPHKIATATAQKSVLPDASLQIVSSSGPASLVWVREGPGQVQVVWVQLVCSGLHPHTQSHWPLGQKWWTRGGNTVWCLQATQAPLFASALASWPAAHGWCAVQEPQQQAQWWAAGRMGRVQLLCQDGLQAGQQPA